QKQARRAYQLALARDPGKRELQIALDFLNRQTDAARSICSRLSFRPNVPTSLSVEYMRQLESADFLIGPRDGWTYYRGHWSGVYESIRTVDRARGPFALWHGQRFADGVIEAKLVLDRAAEFASLLVRA